MSRNDRLVFIEQICHLRLSQPHGFILHADIHLSLSVLGLIDDYLIVLKRNSPKYLTTAVVGLYLCNVRFEKPYSIGRKNSFSTAQNIE